VSSPDIKIPGPNYTMGLSGSLDVDLDNIHIREIAPIKLTSDSLLKSDSKVDLKSDSKVDLGLDNIRIKEIPRIAFNPTRIHSPVNLRFGLCTLGFEVLAFTVCGESMVIVEDYQPHQTEVCA
jgi:hypothetical protein